MNPEISRQVAASRVDDFRREAARYGAARQLTESARTAPRRQLRSRLGFALVEAGLRLLTDPSVAARPRLD